MALHFYIHISARHLKKCLNISNAIVYLHSYKLNNESIIMMKRKFIKRSLLSFFFKLIMSTMKQRKGKLFRFSKQLVYFPNNFVQMKIAFYHFHLFSKISVMKTIINAL